MTSKFLQQQQVTNKSKETEFSKAKTEYFSHIYQKQPRTKLLNSFFISEILKKITAYERSKNEIKQEGCS